MVGFLGGAAGGATVAIVIKAVDQFSKTFEKANVGMKLLGSTLKIGAGAIIGGATALALVGGASIKAAADFEQTTIAFETMLGSAEEADKFLKELADFATKTPFEIQGVESAARQLMAVGFEAEEVLPTLKSVGDIASGLGLGQEGLQRIILNLGQVKTQGKLTGRELRDFAVAGIPLLDILADQFGVTTSKVQDMVSAGEVLSTDVTKAFTTLTSEGGKFENLMAKQAETVQGKFSNLKDTISLMARDVGATLLPAVHELAGTFSDTLLPALEPLIGLAMPLLLGFLEKMSPFLTTVIEGFVQFADKAGAMLKPALDELMPVLESLGATLMDAFFTIADSFLPVLQELIPVITNLLAEIAPLLPIFADLIVSVLKLAAFLIKLFAPVINYVIGIFGDLIAILAILVARLIDTVQPQIEAFTEKWGDLVDTIKDAWDWLMKFLGAAKDLGGVVISKIVEFFGADGGIVTKPTVSMIGEAGPEAVIPLDKFPELNMGGNGQGIVVNVNGNNIYGTDPDDIAEAISDKLATMVTT